jgi:hypothetical protein
MERLRASASDDTAGGREITRAELKSAVLAATSSYQRQAVAVICAELQRDYAALSGRQAPMTMDRGQAPGEARRGLLR